MSGGWEFGGVGGGAMRRVGIVAWLFVCTSALAASDQPPIGLPKFGSCSVVHGRASWYNGGTTLRIWAIHTTHIYFINDDRSAPMLTDFDHDLFADFTLCPTEPFVEGSGQGAEIKKIEHAKMVSRH